MNQINSDTYKKQNVLHEFFHSCLGRLTILAIIAIILLIVAIITVPGRKIMGALMEDNVRQCIIDNDSIRGDALDTFFDNMSNIFTEADSTQLNQEVYQAYKKYNTIRIYDHTLYRTALLHNGMHPEGIRIGIGLFGIVIPTIDYSDLVITIGPVRGNYNEKLLEGSSTILEDDPGENPNIKPYHYLGDPEN